MHATAEATVFRECAETFVKRSTALSQVWVSSAQRISGGKPSRTPRFVGNDKAFLPDLILLKHAVFQLRALWLSPPNDFCPKSHKFRGGQGPHHSHHPWCHGRPFPTAWADCLDPPPLSTVISRSAVPICGSAACRRWFL